MRTYIFGDPQYLVARDEAVGLFKTSAILCFQDDLRFGKTSIHPELHVGDRLSFWKDVHVSLGIDDITSEVKTACESLHAVLGDASVIPVIVVRRSISDFLLCAMCSAFRKTLAPHSPSLEYVFLSPSPDGQKQFDVLMDVENLRVAPMGIDFARIWESFAGGTESRLILSEHAEAIDWFFNSSIPESLLFPMASLDSGTVPTVAEIVSRCVASEGQSVARAIARIIGDFGHNPDLPGDILLAWQIKNISEKPSALFQLSALLEFNQPIFTRRIVCL